MKITKLSNRNKMSLFGLILIWTRFVVTRLYRSNLSYPSVIFHTSYLLAIICGFTLFFKLENEFLNSTILSFTPHVIIVLFVNDIPILFNNPSFLMLLDISTKHVPVGIVGLYVFINCRDGVNWKDIAKAHCVCYFWFLIVDDHINDFFQGLTYVVIIVGISVVWLVVYYVLNNKLTKK